MRPRLLPPRSDVRAYAQDDEWILPCAGLCNERIYVRANTDQTLRVRHGTGEAVRTFTPAEFDGWALVEWIASVHRYELQRECE